MKILMSKQGATKGSKQVRKRYNSLANREGSKEPFGVTVVNLLVTFHGAGRKMGR
jgi:hypothetical protein